MNNDFIISVHALERFQERFPNDWQSDDEAGLLIYSETMEAIEAQRVSNIPPIELADFDPKKWRAQKSKIAWTRDKTRGYVLVEGTEGLTVATVLSGRPATVARRSIYPQKV